MSPESPESPEMITGLSKGKESSKSGMSIDTGLLYSPSHPTTTHPEAPLVIIAQAGTSHRVAIVTHGQPRPFAGLNECMTTTTPTAPNLTEQPNLAEWKAI
jgi:hypothetical protein